MKKTVLEEVVEEQKEFLLSSDSGLQREDLLSLPDLSSHVLRKQKRV
jgi:hypothetical protein